MPPTNPNDPVIMKIKLQLDDIKDIIDQLEVALQNVAGDLIKQVNEQIDSELKLPDAPNNTTSKKQEKEDQEKIQRALGSMQGATDKIADSGISIIQSVFGLVEQIHERLKKSSPLLEQVENLFNLVWQLFFMPLGNKLGEMLIPAVLQMMDDVMEIWEAFEGMSLGEMFAYAIEQGVIMLSDFLINIGETLKSEEGLVGAIGSFLVTMGEFIRDHGEALIELVLRVAEVVLTHLKEIVAAVIAFKVISTGLQITQILTTAASGGILGTGASAGWATAGIGIAATIAAGALAGGATIGALSSYANGGYVPSTPGGRLAIVGEGGEGEYIFPESQVNSFLKGGSSYTININSYSTDEIKTIIKEVVSDEISQSRLRSGY